MAAASFVHHCGLRTEEAQSAAGWMVKPAVKAPRALIRQHGLPGLVCLVADIIEGPHLLLTLGCQEQAGAGNNEAIVLLQRLDRVVAPCKDDGCRHGMVQLEADPCMGI